MNSLPDHLSYSQINTYLTCPQKYKYHYIDKLPWPFTPAALTFGSAIHSALEKFYLDRLRGSTTEFDVLKTIFSERLLQNAAEKEMKFKEGFDPIELQTQGFQLLKCFLKSVAPGQVLGVEESFRLELLDSESGEALDVPLVGAVDLIEQTPDGVIELVDFKTAGQRYNEAAVQRDLQLSAYSLYARSAYAGEDAPVNLRFDVLLKTKVPQCVSYRTQRTKADGKRFVQIAHKLWRAIQGENFYPNPGWQCTDCPFVDKCREEL
jgi:putative RecB family exonuclease